MSKALEKLRSMARKSGNYRSVMRYDPKQIYTANRFRWENFIPWGLHDIWHEMGEEAKLVAYFMAQANMFTSYSDYLKCGNTPDPYRIEKERQYIVNNYEGERRDKMLSNQSETRGQLG